MHICNNTFFLLYPIMVICFPEGNKIIFYFLNESNYRHEFGKRFESYLKYNFVFPRKIQL